MLCACSCTVRLSELTFLCGECDAAHPSTLVLKCRVCEEELLWDMAAGARTIAPPLLLSNFCEKQRSEAVGHWFRTKWGHTLVFFVSANTQLV